MDDSTIGMLTQSSRVDSKDALDAANAPRQDSEMSNDPQPSVQMLRLERVDGARNMSRYYVLAITPTLLGDSSLVREWGRIGSSVRRRIDLHADEVEAAESLQEWRRRKVRRGYVVAHQA